MNTKMKSVLSHMVLQSVLFGAATAAAVVTNVAHADEASPATAAEHEAKARYFRDRAKTYLEEAAESRKAAQGYRTATNAKGRQTHSPEHKKVAADLEAMAKHDEMLAKDAERIALFHDRQVATLRTQAAK